jgi:hypothetical protein
VSERISEMPVEAKGIRSGDGTVERLTHLAERIPLLSDAVQRLRVFSSADDYDEMKAPR